MLETSEFCTESESARTGNATHSQQSINPRKCVLSPRQLPPRHERDGTVLWRASVHGLKNAQKKLQELAELSSNEHFAMRVPSKEIVGRVNVPTP